jgi:hypothetical protein
VPLLALTSVVYVSVNITLRDSIANLAVSVLSSIESTVKKRSRFSVFKSNCSQVKGIAVFANNLYYTRYGFLKFR